jgi:acyl-CoA thioesterase-2
MSVSFHVAEPGLTHQSRMPAVPQPDALPNEAEIKKRILPLLPEPVRRFYERERPMESRPIDYGCYLGEKTEDGRFNMWIRAAGRLPDEPVIHRCVLAYASDMMLLEAALIPHGPSVFSDKVMMWTSLNHALWIHRPFRADAWLLYSQDSPNLADSRGFSRGLIFAGDGTLVASVAQEGVMRQRRRDDA